MNVLRFTGKDNRSALEQVRAQLGPDALILSSKRTAAGIEICATGELPDFSQAPAAKPVTQGQVAQQPVAQIGGNELQLAALKRELASLRETLQSALGERKWQDTANQRPISATISQRLVTLGLGRVFAGELADAIPKGATLEQAWSHTMTQLQSHITSLSDAELAGFRIKVLVGSSGSGKTRCAIALLAEALRRYRPEEVAIISCGDPRAASALTHTASAINLKVFAANDRKSFTEALAACRWAREVIIDTPGMNSGRGSQDPVLSLLAGQRAGVAAFLVLPATGDANHLRGIAEHAQSLPLAGALITKVDEAVSLGGVVDVVAGLDLPLAGRMDAAGERLLPVTGKELMTNAKRLAKRGLERRAARLKVAV